ncbi:MAG: response regulator transcription factor [Deltaproteobacteria bacterium]|nr:response regulator transcription factor [Deltaproteobacteria bacterium]
MLIVDDDERVRSSLTRNLVIKKGIDVVGEAADGVEAIAAAVRLMPDVVLMDVKMPRMGGIEATREITGRLPWVKVLALSGFFDSALMNGMLEAGAAGYLCKTCGTAEIEAAIRHVAEGGCWLGDEASAVVVAERRSNASSPSPCASIGGEPAVCTSSELTPRERNCLAAVAS